MLTYSAIKLIRRVFLYLFFGEVNQCIIPTSLLIKMSWYKKAPWVPVVENWIGETKLLILESPYLPPYLLSSSIYDSIAVLFA